MLPNWLHIGASKCASSWLWRVCQGHPELCVPETPDNVNFFTVHYHRGLGWYERTYFADYAGEPVAGEFSNSYMRRLYDFLGVDPEFASPLIGQNINPDPPDMWDYLDPDIRAELVEVYRSDVEELAALLGRDLSHWMA